MRTLSLSSWRSPTSLPISLLNLPISLSASALRCFSLAISFPLDSNCRTHGKGVKGSL